MNSSGTQFDARAAWERLGTAGKVASAAAILCVVVLGAVLPGFVRAVLAPSAETQSNAAGDKDSDAKYKEKFPGYLAQIEGRSLFLVPGPPVKEVSKEQPPEDEGVAEKTKPESYGGPAIIGMMNDAVWFDNGKRLVAGGEKEGDLRVVSVNIPWEATVEWQEVEFKVGLFTKDNLVIKEKESAPKAEPPVEGSGGDEGSAPEKADASKGQEPGVTAAKAEAPKPVEPKPDGTKPDAPTSEPAKPEAPKAEPAKPEEAKPSAAPAVPASAPPGR